MIVAVTLSGAVGVPSSGPPTFAVAVFDAALELPAASKACTVYT